MNVKPGDLAIQIKSSAGNEGAIVEILGPMGSEPVYDNCRWHRGRGFCWMVRYVKPVNSLIGRKLQIMPTPDSWLRPVSGLPDEQHTEEDNKLEA